MSPISLTDNNATGLAIALVALLALTILLPFFVIAFVPARAPALQDHLALIFTPLVALVASAVGYYFGARTSNGA